MRIAPWLHATARCLRAWWLFVVLLFGLAHAHAGLVLHYKFDETSGTSAADSSGGGNTGTLTNMTGSEWATGKIGGALSFDGTNDYVRSWGYKGVTGTSARTIALWFNTPDPPSNESLLLYGGGGTGSMMELRLKNSSLAYVSVNFNGGSFNGGSGLADGNWHHVAVTLPTGAVSGDAKLYVDGALAASGSGSTVINTTATSDVQFGYSGTYYFTGLLDDVRMYDYALSASEITGLANPATPELAETFAFLGLLVAAALGFREWRARHKGKAA